MKILEICVIVTFTWHTFCGPFEFACSVVCGPVAVWNKRVFDTVPAARNHKLKIIYLLLFRIIITYEFEFSLRITIQLKSTSSNMRY